MSKQSKTIHERAQKAALAVNSDTNSYEYQIAYAQEEYEYWKGRDGIIARDIKRQIRDLKIASGL